MFSLRHVLTLRHQRNFSSSNFSMDGRIEQAQADSLIQIGTRRIFDESHDQFRETCRRFWNEQVVPFHSDWEKEGMVPRELWKKAGEAGLLGINTSEEYGGLGADYLYASIMHSEQGISNCSGFGCALHSDIVMPYIANYGSQAQKEYYLPKLASGELIGAIAMTEPMAGSDLQGIKTTASAKGDGQHVINGSKTYITNGYNADVVITVTKTEPEKGAHGISLFLVDTNLEGFRRGKLLKKMGLHAQDTAELFFDDVVVNDEQHLLGEKNKGFYYLMNELPQERLLIAEIGLSTAEAAFEWTREFLADRKAFGKPLNAMQTIRHKLAKMKVELCTTRAFVDACTELHNEKRLDTGMASMAKVKATELQCQVINDCVQLHGGAGFMAEYPICKAYLDARVQPIYGGTNEVMLELISRQIVKS